MRSGNHSDPSRDEAGVVAETFQARVHDWIIACFGAEIGSDKIERNHRFIEEALELVQSTGCTRSEAQQLVDYVYDRPVGEPFQEAGGVMNTLAALCTAHGLDLDAAAEAELARVWTKVEKIRAKQAAKPKHSPLPEHVPALRSPSCEGGVPEELRELSEKATPGPWYTQSHKENGSWGCRVTSDEADVYRGITGWMPKRDVHNGDVIGFDAELIAHSVNFVRDLLSATPVSETPPADADVIAALRRAKALCTRIIGEGGPHHIVGDARNTLAALRRLEASQPASSGSEDEARICLQSARMFLGWPNNFFDRAGRAKTEELQNACAEELAAFLRRHRDNVRATRIPDTPTADAGLERCPRCGHDACTCQANGLTEASNA